MWICAQLGHNCAIARRRFPASRQTSGHGGGKRLGGRIAEASCRPADGRRHPGAGARRPAVRGHPVDAGRGDDHDLGGRDPRLRPPDRDAPARPLPPGRRFPAARARGRVPVVGSADGDGGLRGGRRDRRRRHLRLGGARLDLDLPARRAAGPDRPRPDAVAGELARAARRAGADVGPCAGLLRGVAGAGSGSPARRCSSRFPSGSRPCSTRSRWSTRRRSWSSCSS